MQLTTETIARFDGLFTSGDGCWEWSGSKDKDGYGRMRIGGRKTARAHRVAWAIAHSDPGRLLVCHHCDNPACVRPDHLFLGTVLDNNRDRKTKGRPNGSPGEKSGHAKLTEAQVLDLVDVYRAGGVRQQDLAARFGVSQGAVHLILSGKNWKHAGIVPVQGMRHAPKKALRALPDETRAELIAEYRKGGASQACIAERYGVSQGYVSQAVRGA
jgi:DNA-binding MarR family transcriptional regulator